MNFNELNESIRALSLVEGVDFFIVGYSLLGQEIYGAHVGNYEGKQLLCEGAIHAREYITASLLVNLTREYATRELNGGIYFIPMCNPDGVRLVLDGVDWVQCSKTQNFLLDVNEYATDFSNWKADANAVDLNVNFNALWGKGSQNVFCPSPGNFVGYYPNSEREVRALIDFTLKNQPAVTLSYHTKGEVIYYGFETLTQEQIARDRNLAEEIAQVTGYQITRTQYSTGGYSDWVSENLQVPALTIEVGETTIPHPITEIYLPQIIEQNREVPQIALNFVNAGHGQETLSASATATEISQLIQEKTESPKIETKLEKMFTEKIERVSAYSKRKNRYRK